MSEIQTFNNEFDLTKESLENFSIQKANKDTSCLIKGADGIFYGKFILSKNSLNKIICEISFRKNQDLFLPRIEFRKIVLKNDEPFKSRGNDVIINLQDSDTSNCFWTLINFLKTFKDIVDCGEFENKYKLKVLSFEEYLKEYKSKLKKEQFEEVKELIKNSKFSEKDFKELSFISRSENLKGFYTLIKNITIENKDAFTRYFEKYNCSDKGKETVWHHFLKQNDWILGLNTDIRFIRDLWDEQYISNADSDNSKNPKVDFLGINDFTVLIEIKHHETKIFKKEKSTKSRANTWDFTEDFIEGISQCLGQKSGIEESFKSKDFLNKETNKYLDKNSTFNEDPKSIFIIGNKKIEFGDSENTEHRIKLKTFERFRRNNRNIDIITYDELFERAYFSIYLNKLNSKEWFNVDENIFFRDFLK